MIGRSVKCKTIFFVTATLVMASCGSKQGKVSYDELGESGLTTRTEYMRDNLKSGVADGTIIGQQYGTLQGVGWVGDSARSDISSICGDGPAAYGYELKGIEKGLPFNDDSIAFSDIRRDVLAHFRHGALITMTWTPPADANMEDSLRIYTDALAKFMESLQDEYGIKVPVVLFPYPMDSKSWYSKLSASDFIALYHHTVTKLKEAGVTNAVYGYATEKDLTHCPIDDVDVVEWRHILPEVDSAHFDGLIAEQLVPIADFSNEHFKAFGVMTGIEGIGSTHFFSQQLLPLISGRKVAYLMFGRNDGEVEERHFCVPYPGMNKEYVTDFIKFYNDKKTLFHHDLNGLYLKK